MMPKDDVTVDLKSPPPLRCSSFLPFSFKAIKTHTDKAQKGFKWIRVCFGR